MAGTSPAMTEEGGEGRLPFRIQSRQMPTERPMSQRFLRSALIPNRTAVGLRRATTERAGPFHALSRLPRSRRTRGAGLS